MAYIFIVLFPPLAVLIVGRPWQALLNLLLTFCFYLPGVIHAFLVVMEAKADRRNKKLIQAMGRNR